MVLKQVEPSLLVSSSKLSAQAIASAVQVYNLDVESTTVLTKAKYAAAPNGDFDEGDGYYRNIVSIAPAAGEHSLEELQQLSRLLQSGGKVVIQEASADSKPTAGPSKNLLLAGFTGASSCQSVQGGVLDMLKGNSLTWQAVSAQKPDYAVGAKFALRKKKKMVDNDRPAQVASVWRVETDKADGDLINEDELLDEADLAAPAPAANDDCDVGKGGRKACKNCTCGRAEGAMPDTTVKVDVKNVYLTEEQRNNPQSACGSCGLGDAYRCAGCPYLGMPAFKLGEKIELAESMMEADI